MSSNGASLTAEHHFRKVIPGHIDAARQRLCDVMEDFGYIVLSENPLAARRPARRNVAAANVLEYETQLTVALRSLSPVSTVATFDYHVNYLFANSERLALEREADAIIALATAPAKQVVCPACAVEMTGAVRFCRACGTPIARAALPAELEVMRLMGGGSAAQVEIGWGATIMLFALLIALPMIFFGNPKAVNVGWGLLMIGELLGMAYLLWGLLRLHRTLNASQPAQSEALPDAAKVSLTTDRDLLPPPPASVTESTTQLMDRQPVPVRSEPARTTGELN
jgi:hypothetical protein